MRLADCFTDMMAYTLLLKKKTGPESIPFDQAHAHMDRLIRESEVLSEQARATREDYDLARFAVFAWIDEAVMGSAWEGRGYWQGEQLQRRYYQTSDAGELFFQKLNTIGPHQNPVREVYYLCLALGFTGQYHNQGDDMLIDQLKTSNLKLLTGSSMDLPAIDRMQLFPDAYRKDPHSVDAGGKGGFSLLTAAAFLVPVGLYGILFFIYRFVLSNVGETLISRIP
ncbi:DotU family type IV/VI secretion system protein [Desulfospira joergensenii]|uniref:DotU family type IV/VI secretion system protein n=1 Tax=Desulfospira joergensenii TaxID=53329 RepID=UPI0003B57F92|nr:DotU family type IV/VI secretion system protein [Desulfospira joergensenii]